MPYHHGDLRAALIDAGGAVLGEGGLARFSVAEVARRAGVSSAAPYRHFADREELLAAVVQAAARQFTAEIRATADTAGPDPAERFVAGYAACTRFSVTGGVGVDVIYREEFQGERFANLHADTRELNDALFDLALAVSPTHAQAITLFGQALALAQGYAALSVNGGLFRRDLTSDEAVTRAADATRVLLRGHQASGDQAATE